MNKQETLDQIAKAVRIEADAQERQLWCRDLRQFGPLGAEECRKCTGTAPYTRRDLAEVWEAAKKVVEAMGEARGDGYVTDLLLACGRLQDEFHAANRRAESRGRLSEPGGMWSDQG